MDIILSKIFFRLVGKSKIQLGYLRNVTGGEVRNMEVHLVNNKDTEAEVGF